MSTRQEQLSELIYEWLTDQAIEAAESRRKLKELAQYRSFLASTQSGDYSLKVSYVLDRIDGILGAPE